MPRSARAVAHANIALVKYWGKVPGPGNLPAVPSLSLTLEGLSTCTRVTFDDAKSRDEIVLGGAAASAEKHPRVVALLDRVRARAGTEARARVETANDFPTASGLASSASGFAALAVAAARAAGLRLPSAELSDLARQSSASAARSLFGGFVTLEAGEPGQGFLPAEPLLSPESWDLVLTVAITTSAAKAIGSTEAMRHTAATSPYYPAWVASSRELFARAREAVLARDLKTLGEVAEASALSMHACALAARPAIAYFNGATMALLHRVRSLRAEGVTAYATMDAGPHVKVLSAACDAPRVAQALEETRVVERILVARPGAGARAEGDEA